MPALVAISARKPLIRVGATPVKMALSSEHTGNAR
jgi:hypothetical protein